MCLAEYIFNNKFFVVQNKIKFRYWNQRFHSFKIRASETFGTNELIDFESLNYYYFKSTDDCLHFTTSLLYLIVCELISYLANWKHKPLKFVVLPINHVDVFRGGAKRLKIRSMLQLVRRLGFGGSDQNHSPDSVAVPKLEAQNHHGLINFGNTCYCNSVIQVYICNFDIKLTSFFFVISNLTRFDRNMTSIKALID